MTIAADCCIYTNHNFRIEKLTVEGQEGQGEELPASGPEPKQIEIGRAGA